MRLLLVDDDPLLADTVVRGLRREGYALDIAPSHAAAECLLTVNDYDLVLLDWNLPDGPGLDLCPLIRGRGRSTAILMLTVRTMEHDRVVGLDAGADDYLGKPFGMSELKARLRALLRRQARPVIDKIGVGGYVVDRARREVRHDGRLIHLTPIEYAIVEVLALNAGRWTSRAELVDHVWDDNHDPASHSLEVHMANLRSKCGGGKGLIRSCRGYGYVLGPSDEATN
ncbi:MAG: response regulator transcription factor [Gemmatimonadales bacterium]